MSIEFDFSEMGKFSAELERSGRGLAGNVRKAVEVSANKGKRAWRDAAKGRSHLAGYPAAIDYDIEGVGAGNRAGDISAELGPRLGGQGSLGIVEDAPGKVGSSLRTTPQRNYEKAEKVIEKDLVVGILKAVEDSLGGL